MMFSRACKTNDLNIFIYVLGEMRCVLFACNRPNYARWMVRYQLNLLDVDNTNPGLRQVLENGALTMRRTHKTFSRTAVDLTFEQSIHADAASRHTGISAFSTIDGAKSRWTVTSSARSAIVTSLFEKAGLKACEDTMRDIKVYRIAKDNDDLKKIKETIKARINPFHMEVDDKFYCLTTGRSIKYDIKHDLLHCIEIGQTWCQGFVNGYGLRSQFT